MATHGMNLFVSIFMILCATGASLGLAAAPGLHRMLAENGLPSRGLLPVPDGQLRCPRAHATPYACAALRCRLRSAIG
jgi:hypothetical protein